MQPLSILPNQYTPGIFLDAQLGVFNFYGFSLPENAELFFHPVYNWLEMYALRIWDGIEYPDLKVAFKLDYFNSSTYRAILHIHSLLYHIGTKHKVLVYWRIDADDMNMINAVKDISEITQMPVTITYTESE
jgi:hypothetical protein